MIQVKSVILTAALLGHASAQGCYPAYITNESYSAGEMVSATTITESTSTESCTPPGTGLCPTSGTRTTSVTTSETHNYECRTGAAALFCSQGSFAPNGIHSGSAWIMESAECSGTAVPPAVVIPQPSGQGCPAAFSAGATYDAADLVSVAETGFTRIYQCADEPTNAFCGISGYEPGTSQFWEEAWTALGSCTGTIAPTSSPNFDTIMDVGGCPGEYAADAGYGAGDQVSKDGLVFECGPEPISGYCSQPGYEPGTSTGTGAQIVEFWRQAWTVVGFCAGTIVPTSSPSFDELTDVGGCPGEYAANAGYDAGDQVSKDGLVFECGPEPVSGYCSQTGYEPGTSIGIGAQIVEYWRTAWTVVGFCAGTITPTSSPSFDPANSVGGCADEWQRGSSVSYEEGDMVSVTISTMPLRQLAYRCNMWPLSGHCGQLSPIEFGGDLGWAFAGTCDGSIGPTASPSFDALSVDASGCPEEFSVSKTDYEAGDRVSVSVSDSPSRDLVYECNELPNALYCNQGVAFAPDSQHGFVAWTIIGACSGTIAPTHSPVQYAGMCQFSKCVIVETVVPNCVPGSNGCSCLAGFPAGADCENIIETENCTPENVNPWSNSVQYVENDVVRLGVMQFRCREWPNVIWCSNEAYMPTMDPDGNWPDAWIAIQDCPP